MRQVALAVSVFLLSALLLIGCGEREEKSRSGASVEAGDVKTEMREAAEAAAAYTQQQKEKYQKRIQEMLDDYDQKLDALSSRAEAAKEQAGEELQRRIAELRKKREEAARRLREVESATGKAWQDMKSGLDAAMEDLKKSFDQALARFTSSGEKK
jgi:DNA repair exonuclease SbcCD ATPase subunit